MAARRAAFLFLISLAAQSAENWKPVREATLRSLFVDKEYGDDAHFAYRFRPDGTFSGTEMGRDVRGAWRATGREMCWKWIRPPGAEECYRVERDGAAVRLLKNGSEAWYGTLKTLPK
jgi:hypothetical protein